LATPLSLAKSQELSSLIIYQNCAVENYAKKIIIIQLQKLNNNNNNKSYIIILCAYLYIPSLFEDPYFTTDSTLLTVLLAMWWALFSC
jgi:hypothetical protein